MTRTDDPFDSGIFGDLEDVPDVASRDEPDTMAKKRTIFLVCLSGYPRMIFARREPADAFSSKYEGYRVVPWDVVL